MALQIATDHKAGGLVSKCQGGGQRRSDMLMSCRVLFVPPVLEYVALDLVDRTISTIPLGTIRVFIAYFEHMSFAQFGTVSCPASGTNSVRASSLVSDFAAERRPGSSS
jgi:hypothetical protein